MERLTERLTDKSYCISDIRAIQKETFYEDMECRRGFDLYTGKAIDKLAEYEDLEEQNRLIKLPCAVGDTVYVKMQFGGYVEAEVRDFTYFTSCGFCIVVTSKSFNKQNIPFSEFGKTVFLTKPEAEAKLAEMEGKK